MALQKVVNGFGAVAMAAFAEPETLTVIGVGEAGAEAVLPIDKLSGMLNSMADNIVNGIVSVQGMGGKAQDIVIPIYLYPSGPKMGEETVRMYDRYKRQLG